MTPAVWRALQQIGHGPLYDALLALDQASGGGGGGPGPPGPPGPIAASVLNVAAIVVLPTAGFLPGTIVHMQSVWDYWSYDPFDSTSVANGITIVPAVGGGFWHRMDIADQLWIHQTTWFIDSVAGNDENLGNTSLAALKTHAEYNRRVGGPTRTLNAGTPNIFVTLIGIVPNVFAEVVTGGPTVTYESILPAALADTVFSVVLPNPATQTPETVTLTTNNWGGQKLAHDNTNGTWFWGYDDVLKTAQVSPPAIGVGSPGPQPAAGHSLSLYNPLLFARLPSFSFQGTHKDGQFTPAIVLLFLDLRSGVCNGDVQIDKCLLSDGVNVQGSGGLVGLSATRFSITTVLEWSGDFVLGQCFIDGLAITHGYCRAYENNFISLELQDAEMLADEVRLISSASRPMIAFAMVDRDSTLIVGDSLWSDPTPAAMVSVRGSSQITVQGPGGLAGFNVSTISVGVLAPNASPVLLPGGVIPAQPLCDTPALFFAAPFGGKAFDYDSIARISAPP